MNISEVYSNKLDSLMANSKKDKKKFLFFKGFNKEFFLVLSKKNWGRVGLNTYINDDYSIDIDGLEVNKGALIGYFFQIIKSDIYWGFYEEFISLSNSINNIRQVVDADFIVVENNLFNKYYPLSMDSKSLKSLAFVIDKEEEDEGIDYILNYYSDIMYYSSNVYGIQYNEKDNNLETINFYSNTVDIYTIGEPTSGNCITLLNLFEFKSKLQNKNSVGNFNIVLDNHDDIENLKPLVNLAKELNIKVDIVAKDRFVDLSNKDDDKYLYILKQYWGPDKTFRQIDFYKNPEESAEVMSISQGNIISYIIDQCKKALNKNIDFTDIFITAPTGAGKSLLFQIPAIYLVTKKAVTIVITPLIALMRDQVEQLTYERGIDFATFLNSEISFEEREARIKKIKGGEISIVYMSPELFISSSLQNIIGDRDIGLLVVDEAHIVTTWGRDFRADYWFLGTYVEKLRRLSSQTKTFPIVCLTATAVYMGTEDTVNDTINTLALNTPKLFLGNVRRKNIKFDIKVVEKSNIEGGFEDFKLNKCYERIKQFILNGNKSLIYCPYTTQIEEVSSKFDEIIKSSVGVYYGGYDKNKKIESQMKFKKNEYKVMICTKAFGMGVDISDIDTVYHFAPTGNLSDYIQEIGRLARRADIEGVAISDFTKSDMKYARMLSSLSSIRQYQLKEVLRKIYDIYNNKKKRNLLVSPETFLYLFGEKNIENKVKTSLLLLEKDINKQFNVIIVRPKSMYTKNYINVPASIEKEFIKIYGQYSRLVNDYSNRVIPGSYKNGDIIISNSGNIYEVNMAAIWENKFSQITFPSFKWKFFNGELFEFENSEEKLTARVHLKIAYKGEFEKCKSTLKDNCNKLSSLFTKFKNSSSFFTKSEFKKEFKNMFCGNIVSEDMSDIVLDMFVADSTNNIGFNQNSDKYRFVQQRKTKGSNEFEYRVMNSNYSTFGNYMVRQISKCVPNNGSNIHSAYIPMSRDNVKSDIMELSILLEVFGVATYEIIGGKNTEIFIRINDPIKIKMLSSGKYRNEILTSIEKKRKNSQEVLQKFMLSNLSNDERWDVIEDYFLGNEDVVKEKLHII
ncbi:MAG: helicase-related protein [Clostridium sp.]|uniref:DEAD/DEAH box helicase n=1 Tax=Clostridium sp. TaxID=1506 RepID=UPI00304DCBAC